MKYVTMTLSVVLALTCLTALGKASDGWIELFDGKDLEGWEQKGGAANYEVKGGAIVGTSVANTKNSFLCTKEQYANFILEFEVQGHPEMNSGVQIRSHSLPDYKDGRVHGYQCELEDESQDRDWSAGIYDEGRRGWLFPTKEDAEWGKRFGEQGKRLWKNGEWNHIRIEANGDHIRTWLNGELRADLTDDMTATGFIGLQVHGVGGREEPMSVRWRNIRLKPLD